MIRKKSLPIMTYFILLMCAISSLYFETSSARYVTPKTDLFSYNVKYMKMTGNVEGHRLERDDGATKETFKYVLSFKRSGSRMHDDEDKDTYVVNVNSCRIDSIYADGKFLPKESEDDHQITFLHQRDQDVDFHISCDVDKINDGTYLAISADVYEYFGDDVSNQYKFGTHNYREKLVDYYDRVKPPEGIDEDDSKKFSIDATKDNKYEKFIAWLKEADKVNYLDVEAIEPYIRTKFSGNDITDSDIAILNSIEGLTAENIDGVYHFTIDNHFYSYANTYYNSIDPAKDREFYFSKNSDALNIDDLFFQYLDKYLYAKNTPEYIELYNFIKNSEAKYAESNIIDLIQNHNDEEYNLRLLRYNSYKNSITGLVSLYDALVKQKPIEGEAIDITSRNVAARIRASIRGIIVSQTLRDVIFPDLTVTADFILQAVERSTNDVMFDSYSYFSDGTDQVLIHIYADDAASIKVTVTYVLDNHITLDYSNTKLENKSMYSDFDIQTIRNNYPDVEIDVVNVN